MEKWYMFSGRYILDKIGGGEITPEKNDFTIHRDDAYKVADIARDIFFNGSDWEVESLSYYDATILVEGGIEISPLCVVEFEGGISICISRRNFFSQGYEIGEEDLSLYEDA